jgi:hypothetical protein
MFLDVSIFGPLKPLHIMRESCLMIPAFAYQGLAIDRIFATKDPEIYERQKKPYISCILILLNYTCVAIIESLRYSGSISMKSMPILISIGSLATIPVKIFVK